MPRRVVDKYVLDGSGDYRFVEYDEQPGHLHGFIVGLFGTDAEHILGKTCRKRQGRAQQNSTLPQAD